MKSTGLLLIAAGALLVIFGAAIVLASKYPFLGNLPGDLRFQGKNSSWTLPITTCVLISLALTVLINAALWLFRRFFH